MARTKNTSKRVTESPDVSVSNRSSSESSSGSNLREPVKVRTGSPLIVPIIMFGAILAGVVIIIANYTIEAWQNPYLLVAGLGAILVGLIAATMYR